MRIWYYSIVITTHINNNSLVQMKIFSVLSTLLLCFHSTPSSTVHMAEIYILHLHSSPFFSVRECSPAKRQLHVHYSSAHRVQCALFTTFETYLMGRSIMPLYYIINIFSHWYLRRVQRCTGKARRNRTQKAAATSQCKNKLNFVFRQNASCTNYLFGRFQSSEVFKNLSCFYVLVQPSTSKLPLQALQTE